MTFEGTLYQGSTSNWKIRVSPTGVKDMESEEIFKVWFPNGDKNPSKKWVFYNPKIAFIIQYRFDNTVKYYVPVSMFYALKDALKVMYNRVLSNEMYSKIDGKTFLNESKAIENRVRLTMFSDSIIFTPMLIEQETDEGIIEKKGVKIDSVQNLDKLSIPIDVIELKTIYEILNRLDINTYTLILSLSEQITSMDKKLDKVLDLQTKILKLIEKETVQDIKDKFTVEW